MHRALIRPARTAAIQQIDLHKQHCGVSPNTSIARHMRTRRAGSKASEVWAEATVDLRVVWHRLQEPAEYKFIQCVCQDDLSRQTRHGALYYLDALLNRL